MTNTLEMTILVSVCKVLFLPFSEKLGTIQIRDPCQHTVMVKWVVMVPSCECGEEAAAVAIWLTQKCSKIVHTHHFVSTKL